MKQIPLTRGMFALVDDTDFEWLNKWKWHALRGRYTFYAARTIHGKPKTMTLMHRQIMCITNRHTVCDHEDHNGLNNQRSNLRACTSSQNNMNQKPQSGRASKYKGVSWIVETKRWRTHVWVNGKQKFVGSFDGNEDGEIQAALAYNDAARTHYGEFAYLNPV